MRTTLRAPYDGPVTVSIDLSAAGPPSAPRQRRRPVIAGTAVSVVLLVVVAVVTRGRPPAVPVPDDPAAVLRAAAAAVERAPDPNPAPGQARFVATRQFTLEVAPADTGGQDVIGVDQLVEEWIPADPRGTWLQRVQDVGPPQIWDETFRTAVPGEPAPMTEWQGRCGDYYPSPGQDPCDRPGLWQEPTGAFIAGLPREPGALLARLRADAAGDGADPGQEVLVFAAQSLERGLLPRRVRATVYRALALLPGLEVVDRASTLDGRTGVAVGLRARGALVEIVVQAGTGAYVGRCRILLAAQDGLPSGTVTDATSLRTQIVSAMGRRP